MENRRKSGRLKSLWKKLGPGLVTGASDDDPSGIATYSQAGAMFGYNTLWTSIVCLPLMSSIQEMCARIGLVTSTGLTGTIRKHYPGYVLFLLLFFSIPAIILNIGADIAGMGAVAGLVFPKIHPGFFSVLFTITLLLMMIFLSYRKIASILKYLSVVLLLYLIVPFITVEDWTEVLVRVFYPEITFDKAFLSVLVGILGTTISPYLFFWQATMEAEEQKHRKSRPVMVNRRVISAMRTDIDAGMFFAVVVMFFITLTAGSVLHKNNITGISTVEQAAWALKPLAGEFAYILFSIGVIGTGMLAIPVLCGSVSYMLSESFNWSDGLDRKFYEAKAFYATMSISLLTGLALNFLGIDPVDALLWAAILYGLTAPVIIAIILHIANNKTIMGEFANGRRSNILSGITLLVMTAAAAALLWTELS